MSGLFNFSSATDGMYGALDNPLKGLYEMQQANTEQEALMQEKQAQVASDEAGIAAEQKAREVQTTRSEQANAYSASGVLLEGSPLAVLEATRRLGSQEVDALMRRGAAQADLYNQQANITRNQGRASLLGSQTAYDISGAQAKMQTIQSRNAALNQMILSAAGLFKDMKFSGSTAKSKGGSTPNFAYNDPTTLMAQPHGPLPDPYGNQ
jgi:hypothetical protein